MNFLHPLLAASVAIPSAGILLAIWRARGAESPRACAARGGRLNLLLRRLLHNLQMHRGMMSILLNGDASFGGRIQEKRGEIERVLRTIEEAAAQSRDLLPASTLASIQNRWRALLGEGQGLTPTESFERHGAIVQQVLYGIADVAERSQGDPACGIDRRVREMIWRHLPELAEDIGKSRAIGSGVAASGHVGGVDRIRLRFLVNRIGAGLDTIRQGMQGASRDQFGGEVHQASNLALASVGRLLKMIEEDLIAVEKPKLAAEAFFGAATSALDDVYRLYDGASTALAGDAESAAVWGRTSRSATAS